MSWSMDADVCACVKANGEGDTLKQKSFDCKPTYTLWILKLTGPISIQHVVKLSLFVFF